MGEQKTGGFLSGIDTLLKSVYTLFFLRDFFGKIVPGGILLASVAVTYRSAVHMGSVPDRFLVNLPSVPDKVPLGAWLFMAGLLWLSGLALQGLGEKLRQFPRVPNGTQLAAWEERRTRFRVDATEVQQHDFERLMVVKEAAGNGAVAIAGCAAMFLVRILAGPAWASLAGVAIVAVSGTLGLHTIFHGSFGQADAYMKAVVEPKPKEEQSKVEGVPQQADGADERRPG